MKKRRFDWEFVLIGVLTFLVFLGAWTLIVVGASLVPGPLSIIWVQGSGVLFCVLWVLFMETTVR